MCSTSATHRCLRVPRTYATRSMYGKRKYASKTKDRRKEETATSRTEPRTWTWTRWTGTTRSSACVGVRGAAKGLGRRPGVVTRRGPRRPRGVDWSARPPGTASLGLGVELSQKLHDARGRGHAGPLLRLRLLARAQRAQAVGELRKVTEEARALQTRGTATARTSDPFPDSSATKFRPALVRGRGAPHIDRQVEHSGVGGGNPKRATKLGNANLIYTSAEGYAFTRAYTERERARRTTPRVSELLLPVAARHRPRTGNPRSAPPPTR